MSNGSLQLETGDKRLTLHADKDDATVMDTVGSGFSILSRCWSYI